MGDGGRTELTLKEIDSANPGRGVCVCVCVWGGGGGEWW